ncbi:MAG: hypothetical protein ACR2P2_09750 [Nakamurella sp.]
MPADIIVAIPAHDEQHRIDACLSSVLRSVETAVQAGVVGRALVTVSAHRCVDATSSVAEAALVSWPSAFPEVVQTAVLIDETSCTVGEVRARMIAAASRRLSAGPHCWLFNTDADSVVPPEWITQTLEHAAPGTDTFMAPTLLSDRTPTWRSAASSPSRTARTPIWWNRCEQPIFSWHRRLPRSSPPPVECPAEHTMDSAASSVGWLPRTHRMRRRPNNPRRGPAAVRATMVGVTGLEKSPS